MQIAYFGNDWYLDCIDTFRQRGHTISHIFINEEQPFNDKLRGFADQERLPVVATRPTSLHIKELIEQNVDLIFSVEYGWKIPLDDQIINQRTSSKTKIKTLNVHPTLLPQGKGPSPLPWILLKYPEYAGITFHQLSTAFDQGDIVYQQPLTLSPEETLDTLIQRLDRTVPQALTHCLDKFDELYLKALPQSEGSYWPKIENKHRIVDWRQSGEDIIKLSRAFGQLGIILPFQNKFFVVKNIDFIFRQIELLSTQDKTYKSQAGEVIDTTETHYSIAAIDGTIVIAKSDIITTWDSLK
jgi:methionyl-tRNA formyltransferase